MGAFFHSASYFVSPVQAAMQRSTCKSWPIRWQRIRKAQEITEEIRTRRLAFCTTKAAKDQGLSPPAQQREKISALILESRDSQTASLQERDQLSVLSKSAMPV